MTVSFQAQTTVVGGNYPQRIAAGDTRGNGKFDVVSIDEGGNDVSVLLGNGDGTFQSQVSYAVSGVATDVQLADVNGDGKLDILATDQANHALDVLLGNGDGTFQAAQTYAVPGPNPPIHLAIGDFNGDGRPDVAVAENQSIGTIAVLLNNGSGAFTTSTTYSVANRPDWIATADLRGIGKQDLVVVGDLTNTLSVLLGNGDGTFQTASTYAVNSAEGAVAVADLRGNGKLDLIVTDQSGFVGVLLGNGNGTFLPEVTYPVGTSPNGVTVADVNGDGIPDLVVANYSGNSFSVLLGNGNGTFQTQQTIGANPSPNGIVAADLNGDGRPDIIAGTNVQLPGKVEVFLNSGPSLLTTLTGSTQAVTGSGGAYTIAGTSSTLIGTDALNGGTSGANTLRLTGGGTYHLDQIAAASFQSIQRVSVGAGTLSAGYFDLVGGGGSVSRITGAGNSAIAITNVTNGTPLDLSAVNFFGVGGLTVPVNSAATILSTGASPVALPLSVSASGSGSAILVVGAGMIRAGAGFNLGSNGAGELDVSGAASSNLNFRQLASLTNTKVIRNVQLTGTSTSVTLPSAVSVTYVGGANNETVSAANAAVTVFGGTGNEKLVGGTGGGQILVGGSGLDTLLGGTGATTLFGSDSNYFTSAAAKSIVGSAAGSVLVGRSNTSVGGVDTICSTMGAETLFGGTADALLIDNAAGSNSGACVLVGGSGNNTILGGNAGASADTLFGGAGTGVNFITAGSGASQTLVGGAYQSTLSASSSADDVLFAGSTGTNTFLIANRATGGTVTIVNLHATDTINLNQIDSALGWVSPPAAATSVAALVTSLSNGYNIHLPGSSSGVQNINVITSISFASTHFIF